jgi:hypothetical protein
MAAAKRVKDKSSENSSDLKGALRNYFGFDNFKGEQEEIIQNKVGNILTWYLYGLYVSDSQSGFRAYSRRAANLIETKGDRYEYDSQVIREIYLHKLKYTESPINVRYTDYSMGKLQKQFTL